jgi:5-methyltetrahydrofolate--homocysteine methyltransferase
MWQILKGNRLAEHHFRRQHIIDKYIADFVCLKKQLIIEIDGEIHASSEAMENDERRTRLLNQLGFEVIRFKNEEVLSNPLGIESLVLKHLANKQSVNQVSESEATYSSSKTTTFRTLRQQTKKAAGQPNYALSDFIAPKDSGEQDYIGCFAVCAGYGVDELVKSFEQKHDDYNAILVKALADRLAEALAEFMHEKVRKEIWGYASRESLTNEELIAESYCGIRPAPGYPACPDHLEKQTIWDLMEVENAIGLSLTESMAMYPTAAVSGYYFAHPDAKYFGIQKITNEQVTDYASRKGITQAEAEKWLSPVLI